MTSNELRQKFLDFFKEKGHKVIPSASLIPENDPSVLFTTAGMHPLVPYLMGETHPEGKRVTSVQKCIRTDDIDEVGDKVHHTFFEMLGNWSFGDYFKNEAIEWSFEFLTSKDWLNISIEKLAISVFVGDEDAPFDQESYDKWISLGIPANRIAKLPKKNNWWGPAGITGPCGPDTEMFVWTGSGPAPKNFQETNDDPNWVEVWNDVFMQYNKVNTCKFTSEAEKILEASNNKEETEQRLMSDPSSYIYKYEVLKQRNVDTGMGLERMLAVMNNFDDNYRTDLFWPLIQKIEEISGKKYEGNEREFRIIADHIKAAVFAIADGVEPSNKGAGYVIRRLIRRAIVKASQLGITKNFTTQIADIIFDIYINIYFACHSEFISESQEIPNQVRDDRERIKKKLEKEEIKFRNTLNEGLRQFERRIAGGFGSVVFGGAVSKAITGKQLFDLYQSYGFPLELSLEIAKEKDIEISDDAVKEYHELLKSHQELSRTASAGMFKGGLVDAGEIATKYHTATHLLLAALRKVLGDHVLQKGSNINAERLRFDFSHPDKMTPEQIKEVEDLVNEQIKKDLPVTLEEMSLDEAKTAGAMGVFESKYGEKVKVYTIGESPTNYFSREICGGPHVDRTGQLGHFKIQKEESSSAGIRRIKAVLDNS